jgi:predicted DNA-binding transcriptional regulator YafY
MPANKNAMTRYMILDELLSNQYHDYSLDDLTEEVSRRLSEMYSDTKGVVRRTIEKDINYLEYEGPFLVEIERRWVPCINKETGKTTSKKCLRYKDPSFSLFKKELSVDEKLLLKEAFSLLGQFDGLPNLDALEKLRLSLDMGEKEDRHIISFTKNPLENSNLLGELFTAISNKQVIELEYHTFSRPDEKLNVVIHPYLLKEYNRRWFLIAAADIDQKMLNFSLDRIDGVKPKGGYKFIEPQNDLMERFEDIIGVTLYEDSPVYKIYFWVSERSRNYVSTKPLHDSQRCLKGDKEAEMRKRFPMLKDGAFFRIDCKENYELFRELTSFGNELIVLEPTEIQDKVYSRIKLMHEGYLQLRTKSS